MNIFALVLLGSFGYMVANGKAISGDVAEGVNPPTIPPPSTDEDAEKFLKQFGFLSETNSPPPPSPNGPLALSATEETPYVIALKHFQKSSNLPETGELDEATKTEMTKPRCGVLTVQSNPNLKNAVSRWNKNPLSYSIGKTPDGLEPGKVKEALRKAFFTWSVVIPLDFFEVPSDGDIQISWENPSHGDGVDFLPNVLAHAYYPTNGKFHYNNMHKWATHDYEKFRDGAQDIFSVAVHEIGHNLGISHIESGGQNIMNPAGSPNIGQGFYRFDELSEEDIKVARAIYGPRTEKLTTIKFYDADDHQDKTYEASTWSGNTKNCSNYLTYFLDNRVSSIDTNGACVYLYDLPDCKGDRVKIQPGCDKAQGCCPYHNHLGTRCTFNNKASSHQLC